MPVLYSVAQAFLARGAHPTLSGTPATVAGGEAAKMSAVDGSAGVIGLNGFNHVGVLEFAQPAGASLSIPAGQVISKLTVEMIARVAAPITYTAGDVWLVELFDSRTGATIGAQRQSFSIPTASSLQSCLAGGVDAWAVVQATLLDVLSANALRVRCISPGWNPSSSGALHIDGLRFIVESNPAPDDDRTVYTHRQSSVPGRRPSTGQLQPGEIAINHADRQLVAADGAGVPVDLLTVRRFHEGARYTAGEIAVFDNMLWRATTTTGPGARNTNHWAVVDASNAHRLNFQNIQALYDLQWPVLSVRLWRGDPASVTAHNAALAAAGISATWQIMDGSNGTVDTRDRLLQGASAGFVNVNFGNDELFGTGSLVKTTSINGGHNHGGGQTGGHTLTAAQLPIAGANVTKSGTDSTIRHVVDQSAQAHSHTIEGVGGHNHEYVIDPWRYRPFLLTRIA